MSISAAPRSKELHAWVLCSKPTLLGVGFQAASEFGFPRFETCYSGLARALDDFEPVEANLCGARSLVVIDRTRTMNDDEEPQRALYVSPAYQRKKVVPPALGAWLVVTATMRPNACGS